MERRRISTELRLWNVKEQGDGNKPEVKRKREEGPAQGKSKTSSSSRNDAATQVGTGRTLAVLGPHFRGRPSPRGATSRGARGSTTAKCRHDKACEASPVLPRVHTRSSVPRDAPSSYERGAARASAKKSKSPGSGAGDGVHRSQPGK